MASIGDGWIDGAWVASGWIPGGWASGGLVPGLVGSISNKTEDSNSGTHQYDFTVNFSGATSFTILPAIEVGWTFIAGVLTIDTDADGVFGPFTVTGTNVNGDTDQNAFFVNVGVFAGDLVQLTVQSTVDDTVEPI